MKMIIIMFIKKETDAMRPVSCFLPRTSHFPWFPYAASSLARADGDAHGLRPSAAAARPKHPTGLGRWPRPLFPKQASCQREGPGPATLLAASTPCREVPVPLTLALHCFSTASLGTGPAGPALRGTPLQQNPQERPGHTGRKDASGAHRTANRGPDWESRVTS